MDRELIKEYVKAIKSLSGKDCLSAVLMYNISPVMEGLKPSSIITLSNCSYKLKDLWDLYKKELFVNPNNIQYYELKTTENAATIMIYNKSSMQQVIMKEEIREFLASYSCYELSSLDRFLYTLKERCRHGLPHEIGVILGIPLEDVKGFLQGDYNECLMTGYWKVYSNLDRAKAIFKIYDDIREKAINEIIHMGSKN